MSIGLIALLDDVAALAKVAAASLDDIAGQAAKAGAKAAGVVIDDAAVTPRYVVGFAAARELPIVAKIAVGSLRNKLIFLLPAALLLSFFAPGAITPLLMIGGAYLCYEGTEKVYEALFPHKGHSHETRLSASSDLAELEDSKVASAIKTDFILSAEIMAITLAAIPVGSIWTQAIILALVGTGITAVVYGGVALIVKADDIGVALARRSARSFLGRLSRRAGRAIVLGMPYVLKILGVVGTAAMIWVGGGIIVHGLEHYGFGLLSHIIHSNAEALIKLFPSGAPLLDAVVSLLGSGLFGVALGASLIPIASYVLAPAWKMVGKLLRIDA